MPLEHLSVTDPELNALLGAELDRQRESIELIASENFTSPSVMEAVGSVLTNKYAEGYPGRRYYGGCERVDRVENLAIERACKLFNCAFANVQPHSGANANMAAYTALIKPGDTVLGMSLDQGGHLTHGSPVNYSGTLYRFVPYGLSLETETIDYDELERMARAERPALIVGGASAYPRTIDFARLADIAHNVDAKLMVDMAHIAGLVATGAHPSPLDYADIVTSTSHKTLRGPRGGFILTNDEEIARAAYIEHVVENSAAMGEGLIAGGLRLVSGGTDNHLCLVDLTPADVTGKDAERLLERVGLTVNKNAIPGEPRSPFVTSGIRVGSAAATTRGFTRDEFYEIGELIARAVFHAQDDAVLDGVRLRTSEMLAAHPLYPELAY